jgi:YggT family protein
MSNGIVVVIQIVFKILTYTVIIDALLSFFLPPYNPFRNFLDRLVEPLLNPIRRIVPTLGGMDFSPIVLILIFQLLEFLLVRLIP